MGDDPTSRRIPWRVSDAHGLCVVEDIPGGRMIADLDFADGRRSDAENIAAAHNERLRRLAQQTAMPQVSGQRPAADYFPVMVVPDTGVVIAGPIPEPTLLIPQPRPHTEGASE